MEKINLKADISVYCIPAESFPEGVQKAHQTLHGLIAYDEQRKYFGLSRMENGRIIYKAAAEELVPGELAAHHLEQLTIPAGDYQSILITDFMNNIPAIGAAFNQLTELPDIDPQGYCVECYLSQKEVRCMVRVV